MLFLDVPLPLRSLKLSETYQNGEEADLLEQEKKFLTEFRWSIVHADSLINQTGTRHGAGLYTLRYGTYYLVPRIQEGNTDWLGCFSWPPTMRLTPYGFH